MPKRKNRALLHKAQMKIDLGDVTKKIGSGLTQDVSLQELAEDRKKHKMPDAVKAAAHMNQESSTATRGVVRPHFVGRDVNSGIVRESLGRKLGDVNLTFTSEVLNQIRQGLICLKCLEPQRLPWGDEHVPGCEGELVRGQHYMRDWQIIDLAMEFEGTTHIGPALPMSEALAQQEEEKLRKKFARQISGGKSPMKGLKHRA